MAAETGQGIIPATFDHRQISARDFQTLRLDLEDPLAAPAAAAHQLHRFQHFKVLGDRLPRQRSSGSEVSDRPRVAIRQFREQMEARVIAQRREQGYRDVGIEVTGRDAG